MSRTTIGQNPLDSLLTPSESKEKKVSNKTIVNSTQKKSTKSNENLKQRLTVQISEDVVERAKNAVYWTRGLTLAKLTEQALENAISSMEKSATIFNDETGESLKSRGDYFPERREELKSGRPVK